MNEALISGLLGAVMGGTSSIEKSIAEEMAAKQKEEEEKRREERALSLKEREREMERKRAEENERLKREKIAKTAPSKAPEIGIVGNAIDEYQGEIANTGYTGQTRQATPEEALRWSIGKAREEGNEELAKQREDALYKMLKEGREAAKEAREQEEFARGPKPKEPTGDVAFAKYAAEKTYTGPRDASGKPDPTAFAEHEAKVIGQFVERKTYIRPERVAGGPKPLSMAAEDVQQGKVKKLITDISTDQVGKAKVKNTAKENALGQILSDYQGEVAKANPDDPQAFYRIDLNTVERELRGRLKTAQDAAASEAGAKFTEYRNATKAPKETDEQFKARKEAILPNQLHRAFADNKKSTKDVFVEAVKDDFLSSAPKSQTAKPATKIVTDGGKQYTVRLAPDGKYYREENGQFFEYKGP